MATLKFYLKERNKQNLCPVLMCYQNKGKKFRFFTKILASKNNWQNNRLKAISLKDYESNELLETCEKVIKEIEKEAVKNNFSLSVEQVEERFRERIFKTEGYSKFSEKKETGKESNGQSEFFDYYDKFIEASKPTRATSTIFHYKICKKILMNFEKSLGKPLSFELMTNTLFQCFQTI